jgi:hypothetical protein
MFLMSTNFAILIAAITFIITTSLLIIGVSFGLNQGVIIGIFALSSPCWTHRSKFAEIEKISEDMHESEGNWTNRSEFVETLENAQCPATDYK